MPTQQVPDPIADDAPTPDTVESNTVRTPGTALWDVVAYTHEREVLCPECVSDDYARLARENPRAIPYGGPVDRGSEWDCPGPSCGHCHRRITDVTVLHYDGVCRLDWCNQIDN